MPDPKRPDTGSTVNRGAIPWAALALSSAAGLALIAPIALVGNGPDTRTPTLLACSLRAVVDGDTLDADCPDRLRIRLADVDAPERRDCQAEAQASALHLADLTRDGFTARPRYFDRWGRTVASLTTPDGADVAARMIASGTARPWFHDTEGRALSPRPEGC